MGLAAALVSFMLGLLPLGAPGGAAVAAAPDAPNILVIVTDDQRWDAMSTMPRTLDLLADEGTRYTRAFATTPLCCPSRSSIWTGRYTHNHGVTDNFSGEDLDQSTTIQRYLRDAGYRTAVVGKYLNNWTGNAPYFDRWAIFRRISYYDNRFNVNGRMRDVGRYSTDYIADKASDFMEAFEREGTQPWYLYIGTAAAHEPIEPERDYASAPVPRWQRPPSVGEQDTSDKPSFVRRRAKPVSVAAELRRRQLRTLMSVDDLVVKVLRKLEAMNETRNTLVIFTSDQGFFWGEHSLIDKRLPYLEALRIPLILRWPGRIEQGATSDAMVATIDIAPTILEAAGLQPEAGEPLDGRSLLSGAPRDRLLLEYWVDAHDPDIPEWAATVTSGYEYVEYYDPSGDVTFTEYYDLVSDPYQLTNLLRDGDPGNDPETAPLSATLDADRRCSGAACP